jgi:hypothetical protein
MSIEQEMQPINAQQTIDDLTTERDELRVQVGLLLKDGQYLQLCGGPDTLYCIYCHAQAGTDGFANLLAPFDHQPDCIILKTATDAAQYIRGLEDALQQILEIDDIVDGYSYDPAPHVIKHTPVEMWRIAFNALARKERS